MIGLDTRLPVSPSGSRPSGTIVHAPEYNGQVADPFEPTGEVVALGVQHTDAQLGVALELGVGTAQRIPQRQIERVALGHAIEAHQENVATTLDRNGSGGHAPDVNHASQAFGSLVRGRCVHVGRCRAPWVNQGVGNERVNENSPLRAGSHCDRICTDCLVDLARRDRASEDGAAMSNLGGKVNVMFNNVSNHL